MNILYDRFAVYGVGSGNAPVLYVYSIGHLTTAFLLSLKYTYENFGNRRNICDLNARTIRRR